MRGAEPARVLACLVVVGALDAHAQAPPAAPAPAHESGDTLPDPRRCVVLLEELGDVGFRIADAQAVADTVQRGLRTRVGRDGIIYGGIAKSQAELQKMLGPSVETPAIQQKKLDYFKAAEANATWIVRARFGVDKKAPKDKRHWITLACRKKGADPKSPVEERRFEGKDFLAARDALDAGVGSFCLNIPALAGIPIEGLDTPKPAEPPGLRKKELKPWKAPPPRP